MRWDALSFAANEMGSAFFAVRDGRCILVFLLNNISYGDSLSSLGIVLHADRASWKSSPV